jgi:hypothetical protein|tara:strand:- start:360 stop:740 length:381 start_codon:yes stop_codon:yes gene_type:complete
MTSENRFDDFFDFEPEIAYRGALKQFGGTPNQRAFFNTQFENIYNEYEGILGAGLKRGQELGQSFDLAKSYAPTFSEFLSRQEYSPTGGAFSPNSFSFSDYFSALPPALRPGADRRRFAPNVRFQF